MKTKSIKLWKIDDRGNELEVIEYKIVKMLKSTENMVCFIGMTGIFELSIVLANRVNDNGDIKYIVKHSNSLQIPFPTELDGDDDT